MRIKLNSGVKLSEIARAVNSPLSVNDALIEYISTDTRELMRGDLFVALKGKLFDGSDFTEEALSRHAYALSESNVASITVKSSSEAVMLLIDFFKKRLAHLATTVAITGSVGKTSCKCFLKALVEDKFKAHETQKNLNNLFGLFHTVLTAPPDTEVLIVEMGMNNRGEIREMSLAVRPDIAVITNIGAAHIGSLGSRNAIRDAKLEITCGMKEGVCVVPHSEPLLAGIKEKITFASLVSGADAQFIPLTQNKDGTVFDFYFKGRVLLAQRFKICGAHLFTTFCAALTAASLLKITDSELSSAIKKIDSTLLRPKFITVNGIEIYDDTYSSSPEALIENVKMLSTYGSSVSCVLGDMLELGEHSAKLHFSIGKQIARLGVKSLYLVGKEIMHIKAGAESFGMKSENIHINNDTENLYLTVEAVKKSHKNGILLVKASHAIHLERFIEMLREGR